MDVNPVPCESPTDHETVGSVDELAQIGQVADETSLSLRTIRYYEEIGLVVPAQRSRGGFRLYSRADIERLKLIRHMKPLDFSLTEMADILDALEQPDTATSRLVHYREVIEARRANLSRQLEAAGSLTEVLTQVIQQHDGQT